MKLQFVIEAVDKATDRLRGINKAVDSSVERIAAPARKLRAAVNGLLAESGIERVQNAWGNLKDKIAAMPMVAAVSMGGAFAVMHRTVEEVDRLVDMARKLNVPVAQLQRLGYAASVNGSNVEEMVASLQHLSMNMVEAGNGSKEAQLWFARMGIPLKDLNKLNAVQVFERIADKFKAVGDAGQNAEKKIAATRALMGRGGAELVQMLNMGSGAIREFYAEADKFGTLDEKKAGEFKETADNFKRFEASLRGLFQAITGFALPGLDKLLAKVSAMNAQSRIDLAEKIGAMLSAFVEKLPKVLTSLGQISKGVVMLVSVLDSLAQVFGGWDTLIVAFSTLMVAKGAWSIFELVKALGILSGALVMTPAGWFLMAVTGIATAAYLIYKHWEPIKQWFSDLWAGVINTFTRAGNWLADKFPWMFGPGRSNVRLSTTAASAPGAALPSVVGAGAGAAAIAAGQGLGPRRTDLGGTLKIEIDANGQPRVRELSKAPGSVLDYNVHLGAVMVGS